MVYFFFFLVSFSGIMIDENLGPCVQFQEGLESIYT